MSITKRLFKGSDVEMLTVSDSIIGHAISHKELLQAKRKNWADPFFQDFRGKIATFTEQHYGKDAAKDLRKATTIIKGIQSKALSLLGDLKLQIEEDFKEDKAFVAATLKDLGFTVNYAGAQKRSQEDLVDLLYALKQNMTPELKATIVEKGTDETIIDELIAMATELRAANVSQEILKEQRKDGSKELVAQLNAIYSDVISVAKIASRIAKAAGLETEKFSYTANLEHLTGAASAATVAKKAKAAKALEPA